MNQHFSPPLIIKKDSYSNKFSQGEPPHTARVRPNNRVLKNKEKNKNVYS